MSAKQFNYEIHQLEKDADRFKRFMDLPEGVDTVNLTKDKYVKVYEGIVEGETTISVLEYLFYVFNMKRPEDFTGHSMSVSDIVKLDNDYYFCQAIGFEKIKCIV